MKIRNPVNPGFVGVLFQVERFIGKEEISSSSLLRSLAENIIERLFLFYEWKVRSFFILQLTFLKFTNCVIWK